MNMSMRKITAVVFTISTSAVSAEAVVSLNLVDEKGIGAEVGKISVTESKYGLVFTPSLHGLLPGLHGFHVHQNPSCEPQEKDGKMVAALAAGGHLDPAATNKHGEPWETGIWVTCRHCS